jgi:ubiquinone/menaquinone biosynthesis C-methylase UbiE
MTWYADWFDAEQYELVYRDRDIADAVRLARLIEDNVAPAPDDLILDVATGRGRHALVLAERGHRVVGLDLAPLAIATARRRATDAGLAGIATFVRGDMRALPFDDASFDGVVNLFTSFGYFDEEADHGRTVGEMVRVLRPGGWLVQDFICAPYLRRHIVPFDERVVDGVHIRQSRRIVDDAPGGPRVEKIIVLRRGDAPPNTFRESVRLLERSDFERLYAEAGLEIVETFGDYDGGPARDDAPRIILHARRPAPAGRG